VSLLGKCVVEAVARPRKLAKENTFDCKMLAAESKGAHKMRISKRLKKVDFAGIFREIFESTLETPVGDKSRSKCWRCHWRRLQKPGFAAISRDITGDLCGETS